MKAILMYHSIDESGSVISLPVESFRRHVQWIAGSGVAVTTPQDLLELPTDQNAIALTFDDAFENFAVTAWPLLRDHGLAATVFVPTDHVGGRNNWSPAGHAVVPSFQLLSWNALERVKSEGVLIGSHTRSHPDLRTASTQRIVDEVEGAARVIADRLGTRPEYFAYPFGRFNSDAVRIVGATHTSACTTEFRPLQNRDNRLLLPRLDARYFQRPGMLERFGTYAFRRYLWIRAGGRRLREAFNEVVVGR